MTSTALARRSGSSTALASRYGDGKLYIADSYNNKIKVCDLRNRAVETFVGARQAGNSEDPPRFFQPGGLSMAHPHLYVADTNNHTIKLVDLKERTVQALALDGLNPPAPAPRTPTFPNALALSVPAANVRPGASITLDVTLPLEKGVKVNSGTPMPYLTRDPGQVRSPRQPGARHRRRSFTPRAETHDRRPPGQTGRGRRRLRAEALPGGVRLQRRVEPLPHQQLCMDYSGPRG